MARYSADHVCEIAEKAWANKRQWDGLLAECYEFALPDRNPYFGTGTGQPQGANSNNQGTDKSSRRVFDSTLISDAQKLANRLQYELFPLGTEWALLTPGPFVDPQQAERARGELRQLQRVMFAAIALSNFDMAIAEWLLELVVAGLACMLVQKGDDEHPVVFQAVPQSHVALREGAFGFIDAISRKHRMRFSLILQTWPDAKNLPDLPETADGKENDPEVSLLELTYHDARDGVWRYDVILTDGAGASADRAQKRCVVERDYKMLRWSIARWSKAAGETQGRSLVMAALPDARVLSAVKRYILQQAALAIGGVFLVKNDGVMNANTVRIFPGARIPVRSTGGTNGASIEPLQVGGDLQLANLIIDDLVQAIHKIMLNDGVPEIKEGVRSATEWIDRMKLLQQSIGAPFARVLKEGIVPMLEGLLQVLGELQIIPMPENGKIKLNGGEVAVTFNSPLIQQQGLREIDALLNASRVTREIAGVAGGDQAVALALKIEDIGATVAEKLGVEPKMIRPKDGKGGRAEIQQMAGAMMAQAQQQQVQVGGKGGVAPMALAA